jgi:hypothetical protein
VSRSPAFLNQKSPLKHDVFGDLENPFVKHGTHLVHEPVIQLSAPIGFTNKFNAKSNLGKRYGADIKLLKRATRHKGDNLCSGFGRRSSDKTLVQVTMPSEHNITHRQAIAY